MKDLDLSDNFLREVRWLRKMATPELKFLKRINLSNNEIIDLRWLSECYLYKLEYLNLRNNKYDSFLEIEKVQMSHGEGQATSQYEILLSSMGKNTSFIVGFRFLSRHKHSVQV